MLNLYAIKDIKVSCFLTPFFSQNEITAIRAVYQALNQGESQLNMFPADYELFHIGTFDPQTASLQQLPPKFIISCYTLWQQVLTDSKSRLKTINTPLPAIKEAENML